MLRLYLFYTIKPLISYDKARHLKEAQDEYCEKAINNLWDGLGAFPEDLQYEAAVDTLRGRVKIQMHCYEEVDLDDIVRVSVSHVFVNGERHV